MSLNLLISLEIFFQIWIVLRIIWLEGLRLWIDNELRLNQLIPDPKL